MSCVFRHLMPTFDNVDVVASGLHVSFACPPPPPVSLLATTDACCPIHRGLYDFGLYLSMLSLIFSLSEHSPS